MSDTVTNLVGNADPRTTPSAGFQKAQVPLSDLFADVLNKTNFADRMLPQSDLGLARAVERDYEARPDIYNDDQDRADVLSADDASADARETDERSQDSGGAEADEDPSGGQPQDDGTSDTTQFSETFSDDALLALNAATNNAQTPGLTNQPNAASGVELRAKTDGATGDQARAIINRGEIQATARHTANADKAGALGQDAMARANAKLGNSQAGASGQNTDAASGKSGPSVDAVATDKPQTQNGPLLTQSSGASDADTDGVGSLLEKHTLLIRAGAKRAAELHQMKIRLVAHRDAIKKVIAQSTAGSTGTQAKTTTLGVDKPSIEVSTSATPPAAAGPTARPAALFNISTPGNNPGQAGATGFSNAAIGDSAGNVVDQPTGAPDRQTMTSNVARGLVPRPMPPNRLTSQPNR